MAEVRSGSFKTTGYSDANSPDHYVFSWTLASQSIVDNTTTINWEVVAAGGATSGYYNTVKEKYVTVYGVTKTNSDWQTTYNGTKPFSGTTVIKHDSNGKGSFSASCGGAFEFSGSYNSTGSGTWDLPTIHRATTPVLASTTITMGSSINITLTPANSTFKHKLRYDFGSVKGSASGFSVGAEYTAQGNVTVTFTPPTSLGSQIPNNLSGTGQVVCYTYTSSGTHIGTTYVKITLNIPSYTPSITGITLTGKNLLSSAYVQSKSSVTINATVQTSYGANIKSITSVIDGKSYSGLPFTTSVLSSGSKTVKITLVDTRNKSVTVESAAIQVYAYSLPNITEFTLARQSDGTTVIATIKGSIAAINNKNAKTIKVTLNGVTNTVTSSSYTINATTTFTNVSTDKTFTAKAVFTDSYTSVERAATLPTVAVTMDFYKDGNGIAMGKVAEYGDLLDVNWPLRTRKTVAVDGTVTFKHNLFQMGHIYMGGNKTADGEKHIKFSNPDDSANPHNVYIYGGSPDSTTAIGVYDSTNARRVINYLDGENKIFFGQSNTKIYFNNIILGDFVVEEGTNGIWTYRKWNSGDAECWGNVSTTPTTVNGNNSVVVNLPFTFVGTDYKVDISPAKAAMYVDAFGDCATNGNVTHTTTNFTMAYKYSYGTAYAVSFNVTVRGKWK
jgi:hypothetical protein